MVQVHAIEDTDLRADSTVNDCEKPSHESTQSAFTFDPKHITYVLGRFNDRLLTECARVCDHVGHKTVCFDLEISRSLLSMILNGAAGRHLGSLLLLYCLLKDPTSGVVTVLGDVASHEVKPRRTMEAEERCRRIERAIAEMPAGMASALYRRAGVPR